MAPHRPLAATRAWIVALALASAACASPSPTPTAPAAESPPSSQAGQVPGTSATPVARAATGLTATAPGAPRADQSAATAAARLALVEGNYPAAVEQWRALSPTTPDARFGLALSQALDHDGHAALTTLASGRDPRDGFVRGLAEDAIDQHATGMQSLADHATSNADVAAPVWLEIAEREGAAHRLRESADAAATGLNLAQARPLKERLLEVRAQALAALGDNEAAFDAHRQRLALATGTGTLGEQLFRLAQASRDLGKPDAALQALKTALDQFPEASTTSDALRLLDELGASNQVDPYVLGRARYHAIDYRNAVSAFDQYLKTDPNGPDAPSARLYRALASLTPGNEPAALRELDAIADDPGQDTELAAQALLEAGQALESLALPDQAESRYARLLDRFPRLDAAATAAFRLGLVRYVRGADADAIGAWDGLLMRRSDLSPDDVSRALYWRGKALAHQGRPAEAQASFDEAAATRPAGYYALLSGTLSGSTSRTPLRDRVVTPEDEQQFGAWLATRHQDLDAAADTVAADPALARAVADANLGLFRAGNWEADELLARYVDRPDRLYVLARRFTDLGLVGGATRLGQAAYAAASIQTPQDAPAALLKVAFPRPFANLTSEAAGRYGLDPLLLDATLEDASQFDVYAINATSGATGLALMTPVHVDEASHALSSSELDEARATVAVEHQAWLLADRLRRFGGRPEVALSAIATTDRLVDAWMVRSGASDPDVYLEMIDYESVRATLRSALGARLSYAIAYGPPASMSASPKPEPTAPWTRIARLAADVPPDAPASPAPDVGSIEQRAAFARGATLQRDGQYDEAIRVFGDLAVEGSTPDVVAEARLRLGQSLLGAGRPVEAIDPLQQSGAVFLLGRALAEQGRCADALTYFARFAAADNSLPGAHALAAQADCLLQLGRASEAVPLLEHAAATPDLARLQQLAFREKLALARVRAGDVDGARADYAALLAIARSTSYRAELNYYLGVLAPDPSTAAGFFRLAVQIDTRSRGGQAALDELVAQGDPFASSFEAAETRFAQSRYREALVTYGAFLQQNPSDARAAQAVYGEGVALVRLGQDRAGVGVLESVADRFPSTSDAADGVFRAGRIRESLADLDGAAQEYRRVLAMSGAGARVDDAQFRLAFVQFQQGSFGPAIEGWRDLGTRVSSDDERAQALFWLGKALHAVGDDDGARAAWTSARAADPRGFYGVRAGDWLVGLGDPRAQTELTLPRVQHHVDDPLASMRGWVAEHGDAAAAEGRLTSDPGLARADTLLAMGLRQPAIWELEAVEVRLGSDADAIALLGGWEQQRGLYNAALQLAYGLAPMASVSLTSGPAAVRRLVYPLPHPNVLAQAGAAEHVDPLLFSALMLQESVMDQAVESPAQARGLAQLIATTGYDAARALGQYRFRSADLFKPNVNIGLGAFTIGERLARYDQRIFPSLAAYNAAEFNVDGWLLAAGSADVDTFAESIPFTETYPYVQKIYENYTQYLELYP